MGVNVSQSNDMKVLIYSLLAVILSAGCASPVQTTDSFPTLNLQVQSSGRSTGGTFFSGEPVEFIKIEPDLVSFVPKFNETLRAKGLLLNTGSSNTLLVLRATSLQLTTELKVTDQEAMLSVSILRSKDKERNRLMGLPLDGTTIAVSTARINGPLTSINRQEIITKLVNAVLVNFSEQLDKSKSR